MTACLINHHSSITHHQSSMPSKLKLHGALFTVALLFSSNYLISKLGMRELAPLSFAWLRVAGASVILALIARNEPKLSREDGRRVAGFAVLGVVINQSMFLAGLALSSVQVAAILITTIPVFALAAAIVAKQERASPSHIAGIGLAALGALLVVGGEGFQGTWLSLVGALMLIVNCLSYALYLVVSKPHMGRLSARRVVSRMFGVGAVLLLPMAAWNLGHERWSDITSGTWLALALVIAGPTVGAYLLQAWALRHADSSEVAVYTYFQPVLASLMGAFFLGEKLRGIVLVAAVLIFPGVFLATSRRTM
jgi:drug/metabolite transporter (DMT)-like permease